MNTAETPSPQIDVDRIDDAVLALLWLGVHDNNGATWKSFDWATMERLHNKGFISNPVGKTKSVYLSEQGMARSKALFNALFATSNTRETSKE
jgi:hypothetical protein